MELNVQKVAFRFDGGISITVRCNVIMEKFINPAAIRVNPLVTLLVNQKANIVPYWDVLKVKLKFVCRGKMTFLPFATKSKKIHFCQKKLHF